MNENFSQQVKDVISFSNEEVLRLGNDHLGTEHLILGILREGNSKAITILQSLNVDLGELKQKIENLNKPDINIKVDRSSIPFTKAAERALKTSFLEAKLFRSPEIETIHLLLCILRIESDPVTQIFKKYNIDANTVREEYRFQFQEDFTDQPVNEFSEEESISEGNQYEAPKGGRSNQSKSRTPVLDNFGRDLTAAAMEGRLDPVVGREKEIERVSQILSRRKKNNPLLI